MRTKHWRPWIAAAAILVVIAGCKQKPSAQTPAPQAVGPGAAEIAAVRDTLTRGTQPVSLEKLAKTHIGKRCVVVARSAPIPPPPPPLGMVRIMGPTTLYAGTLNDISPEAIKIRAAYPSSGNYKYIEIARTDIESIYLGD